MSDYKEIYSNFETILDGCKQASIENTGVRSPTAAHYYASVIFTKLCTSGVTMLSVCPSPGDVGKNVHWDCSSVAALTRGLIDTYLIFHYLCIEKCSPNEWETRWRLMNLHDHMSRLKMFMLMEGAEDQVAKFKNYTEEVKSDLEKTEYFQALNEKQQKHYLKGNNVFFGSQDELVESAGDNVNAFRWKYRFLSNQIHSCPMGFYRMAESDRGMGVESETEIGYTGMCLTWAGEYLAKAKSGFSELWVSHREPENV